MLFRAPGISRVKGTATPVNQSEQLKADSEQGFDLATSDMITNLHTQLAMFEQDIQNNNKTVEVSYKPGYSSSSGTIHVVLLILAYALVRRKRVV